MLRKLELIKIKMVSTQEKLRVLVTGGNQGIGFALCKQLLTEHACYVYLTSRSLKRGNHAAAQILKQFPQYSDSIHVVQLDVS